MQTHVESSVKLYVKQASGSVDDVSEKVLSAAACHHFGVIAMHDLRQRMQDQAVEFTPECRVFEMCNARRAKQALEANPAISTVLPARISVYEEAGTVKVAMIRPTAMLELIGDRSLMRLAREVEQAMVEIVDEACE